MEFPLLFVGRITNLQHHNAFTVYGFKCRKSIRRITTAVYSLYKYISDEHKQNGVFVQIPICQFKTLSITKL